MAATVAAAWHLAAPLHRPDDPYAEDLELTRALRDLGLAPPEDARLSALPVRGWSARTADAVRAERARAQVRRLGLRAERERSGPGRRRLATLRLLRGEPARAVDLLAGALAKEPASGALWSDLAAAHALSATADERPFDLASALSAALEAVRLAPELPQARFELAEALTRLSLRSQAVPAWESYLELLPSGADPFAEERLRRLQEPTALERWPEAVDELLAAALDGDAVRAGDVAAEHPSGALEAAETRGLGAWASAVLAGDLSAAAKHLAACRLLGEILAVRNRDQLLLEVVERIETSAHDEELLHLLATGHGAYAEAQGRMSEMRYEEAAVLLRAAEAALVRAESPFLQKARLQRGICLFYQPDYPAAAALFTDLSIHVDETRHPYLSALSRWMLALTSQHRGDASRLLPLYLASLSAFEASGDRESSAAAHALLAQGFDSLGQPAASWRHWLQALAGLAFTRSPRRSVAALLSAGDAAASADLPEVALAFHHEAIHHATRHGNAHHQAVAFYSRSLVHSQLGNGARALADLEAAWRAWDRLAPGTLREGLASDILRAEIALPLEGDLEPRLAAADSAIGRFRASGKEIDLPEALAARARIHGARRDWSRRETDLREAVEIVERRRQGVPDEELRVSFRARSANERLFDDLVGLLAADGGRTGEAFQVAESGRARALLDRRGAAADRRGGPAAGTAAPSLEEVQACLPAGTLLVAYAVLPEETLAWSVSTAGARFHALPIEAAALRRLAAGLREGLEGQAPSNRSQAIAGALFDRILGPILSTAPLPAELVIVPDDALASIPFSVLWDASSGRYLVESVPVAVAPSAAQLCAAVAQGYHLSPSAGGGRVLAVGNPSFDPAAFPSLRPLRAARAEAEAVARLYGNATLLLEGNATREAFLAAAPQHEVIAFAGHGIVNLARPGMSALVLAASPGSSGALHAHEVARLHLPRTRLAVLSACHTADGLVAAGEGSLSLARAFLAAGVPAVVATLWDLDDEDAVELVAELHRHLRSGTPPAQALRDAQLRLIRDDPADPQALWLWAAFELVL